MEDVWPLPLDESSSLESFVLEIWEIEEISWGVEGLFEVSIVELVWSGVEVEVVGSGVEVVVVCYGQKKKASVGLIYMLDSAAILQSEDELFP